MVRKKGVVAIMRQRAVLFVKGGEQ